MITKKPVAKHFEFEDGSTTNIAFLDGYLFGERVLEGVMFGFEILPDGRMQVISAGGKPIDQWDDDPYLSGLSKKKWVKEALDYAQDYDIFEIDGEDVDLVLLDE